MVSVMEIFQNGSTSTRAYDANQGVTWGELTLDDDAKHTAGRETCGIGDQIPGIGQITQDQTNRGDKEKSIDQGKQPDDPTLTAKDEEHAKRGER